MRFLIIPAALLLSAQAAHPGAWPRGEGNAFISVSSLFSTGTSSLVTPQEDLRFFGSVFAEYGLSPDWTLGLDASFGSGFDEEEVAGLVFARRTLARLEGGHVIAAELGLGWLEESDAGGTARLRPGLSWGRGFESVWGGGWMAIDTSVEWRVNDDDLVYKADVTLGIRPAEGWLVFGQLQSAYFPGTEIVKFAPNVAYEVWPGSHLQLGLSIGLAGDEAVGVKLAQWFEF